MPLGDDERVAGIHRVLIEYSERQFVFRNDGFFRYVAEDAFLHRDHPFESEVGSQKPEVRMETRNKDSGARIKRYLPLFCYGRFMTTFGC